MLFNLKFMLKPRILKRTIHSEILCVYYTPKGSMGEIAAIFPFPPPLLIAPSLYILGLSHMLITDFKCIRLSLYVKMKTKQNLTNVISTKIIVHFGCLMGCYWLSSLNEESFLPDKFREMTKQSNPALRIPVVILSDTLF